MSNLKNTLDRISKVPLDKELFSENPHMYLSRALSRLGEIQIIENRYYTNLRAYSIKSDNGVITKELEIDFISMFLFMHIYLIELIQVIQVLPNKYKKNVSIGGYTNFINSITNKDTAFKSFFNKYKRELLSLEFELSFYRDKFIEHNNRISFDWKTIAPHKPEFYITYVPKVPVSKDKILFVKNLLFEKFPDIKELVEVKEICSFFRSILGDISETSLRDKVEYILKNFEYRSPNPYQMLGDILNITEGFLDELERINIELKN